MTPKNTDGFEHIAAPLMILMRLATVCARASLHLPSIDVLLSHAMP